MINRKSLIWFLGITFGIAWILFSLPLAFKSNQNTYLLSIQIFFALAMWAPGLAAILTTVFVEKQPFKSLRLNTLGPKRFYLWAWLLPPLLILLTLVTTLLLRTGQFDPALTMMSQALAQAPAASAQLPSAQVVVLLQTLFAVILAPLINVIFTLGEELGWRGFLLPRLLPLGQWPAILISGAIWGFWHAPTTLLHGYNFPEHHYLGILIMIVGCTLLGTLISWLYLNTRSPWVAALAHGAINATAGISFFFLKPGFDTAWGGSPLGLAGWIPMALFIVWLVWSKRLPVPLPVSPATETMAVEETGSQPASASTN
jgi:membrane protease YdiL (CAAX protease family)